MRPPCVSTLKQLFFVKWPFWKGSLEKDGGHLFRLLANKWTLEPYAPYAGYASKVWMNQLLPFSTQATSIVFETSHSFGANFSHRYGPGFAGGAAA